MKRCRGFTLIELMVVITIVGVLFGIAIPAYNDYLLRGKLAEAFVQLSSLQTRMEQYYQDNRTYERSAAATVTSNGVSCTTSCGILPPTSGIEHFSYCCTTASSGQNFTYTATGKGGTTGFTFTVNEAGTKATTSLGASWTGGTTCWIRSNGQTC